MMNENSTLSVVRRGRRKWLRIAANIALPLFGMVIGSGATMCFMRTAMKKAFSMQADGIADRVASKLASRYDLDANQRNSVNGIAKIHIENMIKIRDEVRPRIFAELQEFRLEVGEILTAEQRQRWDGNFAWMLSRWPFPATPAERDTP